MIQNLNRLSFQPFGTILADKPESRGWIQELTLTADAAPAWKAEDRTHISCTDGMAVLSISNDGEHYCDFYLDKPVSVDAGLYFSLCAFREKAAVCLYADTAPVCCVNRSPLPELHINRTLRINRIYTLFYQEKEKGFFFAGEAHPIVELTYVDQGSLHSVADGQDILLEQGDLMLYAPDQWHMQFADTDISPRFMTVTFDPGDYDLSELYNRKFQSPQQVIPLLQQILREYDSMDYLSGDMILSCLSQILMHLKRLSNAPAQTLKSPHCITNENQIVSRAQQYISANIRSRLSVPLVAEDTDVSPSYLTALFHKHLQISPGEYIRRIKLQESKLMIREGNLNFTEIAEALQYSTIHHFSRQFKEKFGITPSQYAKSIR